MYSTETRRAAARRQSDRPPCIDDAGDAEAPPRRAHGITRVPVGPIRQVLMLALAAVVVGVVIRQQTVTARPPRPTQGEGEYVTATGAAATRRLPPTHVNRIAAADERFTVYLVGSAEEAALLRGLIGGDPAEVQVIATDEQETTFRDAFLLTNRVRVDKGLPEITVIDLRTGQ